MYSLNEILYFRRLLQQHIFYTKCVRGEVKKQQQKHIFCLLHFNLDWNYCKLQNMLMLILYHRCLIPKKIHVFFIKYFDEACSPIFY